MAVSLNATGTWGADVGSGFLPPIPGTPVAGDRMFAWLIWKNVSAVANTLAGWTLLTQFSDGAVASGNGTGSMTIACHYRDWQSGDGTPSFTLTAAAGIGARVIQVWSKAAGETWDTPTFKTAAWPVTATNQTINASSSGAVPDNAVVMCGLGFRNDLAAITRTTTSLDASPALTWNGNYVESPAAHFTTTSGNDMACDLGYRLVTTGHAATTLSTQATISTVETGAILWVMQDVTSAPPIGRLTATRQAINRASYF